MEPLFWVDWNNAKRVHDEDVDFGIVDERGRRVGFEWTVYEITVTLAPMGESGYTSRTFDDGPGIYYRVTSQATRNGKRYGALTEDAYMRILDGAKFEGQRRVEVARKRYLRKYK